MGRMEILKKEVFNKGSPWPSWQVMQVCMSVKAVGIKIISFHSLSGGC